eukprot:TRINITY_DN7424_c0_g1_i1.p1 TRINITY_DN7424_c0_g1~~TRINITY_DN7424_c0_g1_i1.p1  ORF type:complete len:528 (+),score=51.81 TRINITY_DN7424_c0_g1_i1:338-1921(+)
MELQDFCEGTLVEVVGLVVKKELNGERGAVVCAQEDRLVVRLPSGDVAVRPGNCSIVGGKRKGSELEAHRPKARKVVDGLKTTDQGSSAGGDQGGSASNVLGHGIAAAAAAAAAASGNASSPQQQDILGAAVLLNSLKSPGLSQVLQNPILQMLSLNMLKQQQQQQNRVSTPPPVDETPKPPGCCLLVVLRGGSAEPCSDDLFWVFSQFGVVEKISLFCKDTNAQALVQFNTPEEATRAMGYLNSRTLYNAELAIMISSHTQLNLGRSDSRNRDYTSLNTAIKAIPEAERIETAKKNNWPVKDFLWGVSLGSGWLVPRQDPAFQGKIPPANGLGNVGKIGDCVLISGLPSYMTAAKLWGLAGIYGKLVAVKILQKRTDCALVQYTDSYAAKNSISQLEGCALGDAKLSVKLSKHANALNWRGSKGGLEHFMCTSSDRPVPESYPISPSPSETLTFNLPKDLLASGKEQMIAHLQSLFGTEGKLSGQTDSSLTFSFPDKVAAVKVVCDINAMMTKLNNTQFKIKICFW